jgi:glutaredoxin
LRHIGQEKALIYAISDCKTCYAVNKLLFKLKADFTVSNLDEWEHKHEFIKYAKEITGVNNFPMIFIGHMYFGDEKALEESLEDGSFKTLLDNNKINHEIKNRLRVMRKFGVMA